MELRKRGTIRNLVALAAMASFSVITPIRPLGPELVSTAGRLKHTITVGQKGLGIIARYPSSRLRGKVSHQQTGIDVA